MTQKFQTEVIIHKKSTVYLKTSTGLKAIIHGTPFWEDFIYTKSISLQFKNLLFGVI